MVSVDFNLSQTWWRAADLRISSVSTVGVNSLLLMTGVERERIIIMQIYLDRDLMPSKLALWWYANVVSLIQDGNDHFPSN